VTFLVALLVLLGAARGAAAPKAGVTVVQRAGLYEVRGEFTTTAPAAIAWDVLTDYTSITRFVASIKQSEVVQLPDGRLRVYQVASVGVFPFRATARVTLMVTEEPQHLISFVDSLGADFHKYTGSWTLRAESGSTVVAYSLDASPRAGTPGWLGRSVMSHSTSDLLAQVRAEIERRAAKR